MDKKSGAVKEAAFSSQGPLWFAILLVLSAFIMSLIFIGGNAEITEVKNNENFTGINRRSRDYSVFYKAGVFSPTNIRIRAGDTVNFHNNGLLPIYIVSDNNSRGEAILPNLDSVGPISTGGIFSYTFVRTGIFGYHNKNNELERGTVIVRE